MSTKKYASLSTLATFLDNIKLKFAALTHTHKLSDLTDYTVDSELSSTSTNPVQNKVIDAEFEAVSEAMNVLDAAIDGKLNASDYVVDSELSSTSTNPVQNSVIKAELDTIKTAITTTEIDEICGASIVAASEVTF